jgi:hypothetical protein
VKISHKTGEIKVFLTIFALCWKDPDPDPDPYLGLMDTDPDPGGPKTSGSGAHWEICGNRPGRGAR